MSQHCCACALFFSTVSLCIICDNITSIWLSSPIFFLPLLTSSLLDCVKAKDITQASVHRTYWNFIHTPAAVLIHEAGELLVCSINSNSIKMCAAQDKFVLMRSKNNSTFWVMAKDNSFVRMLYFVSVLTLYIWLHYRQARWYTKCLNSNSSTYINRLCYLSVSQYQACLFKVAFWTGTWKACWDIETEKSHIKPFTFSTWYRLTSPQTKVVKCYEVLWAIWNGIKTAGHSPLTWINSSSSKHALWSQ